MTKLSRRTFLTGAAGLIAVSTMPASLTRGSNVTPKFDPDQFIEDIKRARAEEASQEAIQDILHRAVSEPGAVAAGLGEPDQAGINTMYQSADLTILNVIWAPMMVLLPHNHNMWATIGIYSGREDNIIWARDGQEVEAVGATSLSEKEVFSLPEDAIHSVVNPIGRLTGAIHIYGGDFFEVPRSEWDPETLNERPFDIDAARRTFQEANDRFHSGG